MIRPFRMLAFAFIVLLLASCGGGPGEADIRALVGNGLNSSGPMGLKVGDLVEISRLKILNKAADGANGYIVDYEYTLRFKKGFRELNPLLQLAMLKFGDFKAGDESKPETQRLRLIKGSNGWMVAEK